MRDLNLPQDRHPEKAHRADNPQPKKPDWIRVRAPNSEGYKKTRDILRDKKLVTVCEEAGCPNVGECWSQGHATMMIMGDICTRGRVQRHPAREVCRWQCCKTHSRACRYRP